MVRYNPLENDQILAAQQSGLSQKSADAPYNTGYAPGGSSAKSSPTSSAPSMGKISPSDYSFSPIAHGSSEWYGNLDEYGSMTAANNPGAFWDLYATDNLGLNPGSATASFYNQNYNPYLLGQAMGKAPAGIEGKLAEGTSLANMLDQPGSTFFDPGAMVTSILSQIANAGNGGKGGQFNELNAITGPGAPPDQQLQNILDFLGETLKSAMPQDTLQAYLGWLSQIGMQIISETMHSGLKNFEKGGGNIATKLMQYIGPNGGL